jgi:hypothetical protein
VKAKNCEAVIFWRKTGETLASIGYRYTEIFIKFFVVLPDSEFLHGQFIFAAEVAAWIAAHEAGTRHGSRAVLADGARRYPSFLIAPAPALSQPFATANFKRYTAYHLPPFFLLRGSYIQATQMYIRAFSVLEWYWERKKACGLFSANH